MVGGIEGHISEKWRMEKQHLREKQHQLELDNFLPPATIVEISDFELATIRRKTLNQLVALRFAPRVKSRACLFGEHSKCHDGCGCYCHRK